MIETQNIVIILGLLINLIAVISFFVKMERRLTRIEIWMNILKRHFNISLRRHDEIEELDIHGHSDKDYG